MQQEWRTYVYAKLRSADSSALGRLELAAELGDKMRSIHSVEKVNYCANCTEDGTVKVHYTIISMGDIYNRLTRLKMDISAEEFEVFVSDTGTETERLFERL